MFLSFDPFLYRSFSDIPPARQDYNIVKFYNEDSSVACNLDTVWIKNVELTNDEILDQEDEPVWDDNTILLGKFEDDLEAGYFNTGLSLEIIGYIVRRKIAPYRFLMDNNNNFILDSNDNRMLVYDSTVEGTLNTTLIEIDDVETTTFTDYTPLNNAIYTYTVYPVATTVNGDVEGTGIEGVSFVSFWGWLIQDAEVSPSIVYYFELDNKTDAIKINKDMKIYENYTQYPAFRFGQMKYKSSSFETVPVDSINDDGTVSITEDYIENLVDFLNNDTEKYLRSPSGKIFKVITGNAEYKYMDEISTEDYTQPISIKFDWYETGAV